MPTVNWTTNGATLDDQCGWSGDGAAHPFVGQFYVDETYNNDSKASAVRLTGAGFSGTINSAILTLGRFNDNTGANGTLRIRCIAENDPGSLAASGGVAPSARTYRTAYLDYNFPNDAVAVNIDITALIQDLLTAGFTYSGTQKIAIVIAGSSVGGTGWGSNATVSWRALWLLSTPPTLAITYTAGGSTATGTGAATGSSTVSGSGKSFPRGTGVGTSSSTVAGSGLSSSRGTGASQSTSTVSGSGASSATAPSVANQTGVAVLYMSTGLDSATTPAITTQAGSAIFAVKCVWQYNTTVEQGPYQQRDRDLITDSFGNAYSLVGSVSTPTNWPSAGEIVQVNRGGTRGSGHTFTAPYALNSELSLVVFEVLNAGAVSNFSIQQLPANGQINRTFTATATSNGRALLIVSAYIDNWEYTAGPTPSGWTLVRRFGVLSPAKDADIHIVVFARQVETAGTYSCVMDITGYSADAMCVQTFAIETQSATVGGSSVTSSSAVTGAGSSRIASSSGVTSQSSVSGIGSASCVATGSVSGAASAAASGASSSLASSVVSCVSSAPGIGSSRCSVASTIASTATVAGSALSRYLATGSASSSSSVVGSGESGAFALGYGPSASVSSAVGSGSSRATITGTVTISSSIAAPGASNVRGSSSVSGSSATTGAGSSGYLANGSTSSSSAVAGSGSGVASGTGIGTASSSSSTVGSGSSRALVSTSLSSVSTAPGQGASAVIGSGLAIGSSTVIGSGESAAVATGTGQATSSSSVSGQAKAIIYALGGSAGQALAMAAGFSLVVATAPIYSASECSSAGVSTCLASGGASSASTVIGSAGSRAQVGVIAMQISNACTMKMEFFP